MNPKRMIHNGFMILLVLCIALTMSISVLLEVGKWEEIYTEDFTRRETCPEKGSPS